MIFLSFYRTINLEFETFQSYQSLTRDLKEAVGNGVIVNGSLTRNDLVDFLSFLKRNYNQPKRYNVIEHVGRIDVGTWYLNEEVKD